MADLTNELRQLADSAAHQARPLPATEILRRADRRRRSAIAQRAAGGLSVLGLIAALIVTTGTTSSLAGSGGRAAPAASGSAKNAISMTETVTAAAGTMTTQTRYALGTRGQVKLISVTFSGHSKHAVKNAFVVFYFGPSLSKPASKRSTFFFAIPVKLSPAHDFSGSLPGKDLTKIRQRGPLPGEEPISVVLESTINLKGGGQRHIFELAADGILASTP